MTHANPLTTMPLLHLTRSVRRASGFVQTPFTDMPVHTYYLCSNHPRLGEGSRRTMRVVTAALPVRVQDPGFLAVAALLISLHVFIIAVTYTFALRVPTSARFSVRPFVRGR